MTLRAQKPKRVRLNSTLDMETFKKLQHLACEDHRDLSHQFDALVEAEWNRRIQSPKEAA
jgi:hypothetical protein